MEGGAARTEWVLILVIDNYDSFAYNLAQYIGELGWEPVVYRNDRIALDEIEQLTKRHQAKLG